MSGKLSFDDEADVQITSICESQIAVNPMVTPVEGLLFNSMSPITPRKAERIAKKVAFLRLSKKENNDLFKAAAIKAKEQKASLPLTPTLEDADTEWTLLDSINNERDFRNTKFAELLADKTLPKASINMIVNYYQLYRGYEANVSPEPFDPAVDYWKVLEAFHTKSFTIHNPSECIRFRRFYSLQIADSIPTKYENLFMDMFRFHCKYNPDYYKNARAHRANNKI